MTIKTFLAIKSATWWTVQWVCGFFARCDRAVSLPCHETPKEQGGKRNLVWRQAWMGEKTYWNPQMLIIVITCEDWQDSEWDTVASHTADWHGNLKESQPSRQLSSGEGSSTKGNLGEHRAAMMVCCQPGSLWRVLYQQTHLKSRDQLPGHQAR